MLALPEKVRTSSICKVISAGFLGETLKDVFLACFYLAANGIMFFALFYWLGPNTDARLVWGSTASLGSSLLIVLGSGAEFVLMKWTALGLPIGLTKAVSFLLAVFHGVMLLAAAPVVILSLFDFRASHKVGDSGESQGTGRASKTVNAPSAQLTTEPEKSEIPLPQDQGRTERTPSGKTTRHDAFGVWQTLDRKVRQHVRLDELFDGAFAHSGQSGTFYMELLELFSYMYAVGLNNIQQKSLASVWTFEDLYYFHPGEGVGFGNCPQTKFHSSDRFSLIVRTLACLAAVGGLSPSERIAYLQSHKIELQDNFKKIVRLLTEIRDDEPVLLSIWAVTICVWIRLGTLESVQERVEQIKDLASPEHLHRITRIEPQNQCDRLGHDLIVHQLLVSPPEEQ